MSERDWLGLELVEAPAATREQLERVHSAAHVDTIEAFSAQGRRHDRPGHRRQRGLLGGGAPRGRRCGARDRAPARTDGRLRFCGLRPPGHHAERDRAMGFCLFNNVAVAAAHAIAECGAERVLILDWDVHHGNGTEAIFYGSSEVLYSSIHQSPLYPGTGAATDFGSGAGEGYTVNLPVPPGSGPDEFLALVQHVVAPIAREWRPDLLCISAGYDAHRDDPLANCELDDAAYRDMAATMRELAGELGVPLLICLEGGYSLAALARSVVATLDAVSGDDATARGADRAGGALPGAAGALLAGASDRAVGAAPVMRSAGP